MNRRNFLRSALLPLGLPAAGGLFGGLARAATGGGRNLIVILARGAWDVTYALDPKDPANPDIHGPAWRSYGQSTPDGDDESLGVYGGIRVAENLAERPSVSGFFNDWHERCLIVNGVAMRSISHDACRKRVLTGSTRDTNPDVAAIAGFEHRGGAALGYIDFSGLGYIGDFSSSVGMVGNANQLRLLLDAGAGPVQTPGGASYPLFSFGQGDYDAIQAYLDASAAQAAGSLGVTDADAALLASLQESRASAALLRRDAGPLISELELGAELNIGDEVGLAVQMLSSGLCRSVLVEADLGWDTHQNNSAQAGKFEALFGGLSALAETLSGAGSLWDETVVVVLSEFTRTPRLNSDDGKDHWPMTSALVFGGGVSGDRVLGGSTDDTFDPEPVDLATGAVDPGGVEADYTNLAAGILMAADVDPEAYFPGVEPYRAIAT